MWPKVCGQMSGAVFFMSCSLKHWLPLQIFFNNKKSYFRLQFTSQLYINSFFFDVSHVSTYKARSTKNVFFPVWCTRITLCGFALSMWSSIKKEKKGKMAAGVVQVWEPAREATVCLNTTTAAPKEGDALDALTSLKSEAERFSHWKKSKNGTQGFFWMGKMFSLFSRLTLVVLTTGTTGGSTLLRLFWLVEATVW